MTGRDSQTVNCLQAHGFRDAFLVGSHRCAYIQQSEGSQGAEVGAHVSVDMRGDPDSPDKHRKAAEGDIHWKDTHHNEEKMEFLLCSYLPNRASVRAEIGRASCRERGFKEV